MVAQIRLSCSNTQTQHSAKACSIHLPAVCLHSRNCSLRQNTNRWKCVASCVSFMQLGVAHDRWLSATEKCTETVKNVHPSWILPPVSRHHERQNNVYISGGGADWSSGMNPNQVPQADAGRDRRLTKEAEVGRFDQTHKRFEIGTNGNALILKNTSFYSCMRLYFRRFEKHTFHNEATGKGNFFHIYRSHDVHGVTWHGTVRVDRDCCFKV